MEGVGKRKRKGKGKRTGSEEGGDEEWERKGRGVPPVEPQSNRNFNYA